MSVADRGPLTPQRADTISPASGQDGRHRGDSEGFMARVRRITVVCALACCLLVGVASPGWGAAGASDGGGDADTGTVERVDQPISGQYIVTLHTTDPGAVEARAAELSRGH